MALVTQTCHDSRVVTRVCRTELVPKMVLALLAAVVIGCAGESYYEPGVESGITPTPATVTTPAAAADVPAPAGIRDDVVYERLVSDGFSEPEANCLARSLSLGTMVSASADELIDVYASCTVDLDRLIELGGTPGT